MSLVASFKKPNDEQKFVAKVAFLNVMRRSNPTQFQSHSILPGQSAHTSYIDILPTVTISSRTHHKVCNDFQCQHSHSPQNPSSEFMARSQHSSTNTTFTRSSTLFAHVTFWWKRFVTSNRFWIVRDTLDILWLYFLILVKNKKLKKLRATTNIRKVPHMTGGTR